MSFNFPGGHTADAWGAYFSPDGKHLVTTSEDSTAIVWDTDSWQPIRTFTSQANAFSEASFHPNNKDLAFTDGSQIRVFDIFTGEEILSIPEVGLGVNYSPDGNLLATSLAGQGVKLLNASNGETLMVLPAKSISSTIPIAFSPDGKHIASADTDRSAAIWEISPQGSREVVTVAHPAGMTGRISVSTDGKMFATTNYDGTVQVWDFPSGQERIKILAHEGAVWNASFSPDGSRLVTAGEDNQVNVWDISSGEKLLSLVGQTDIPGYTVGGFFNGMLAVTYSPDGSLIAAAGEDGIVWIWDSTTGEQLYRLKRPS